MIDIKSVEEKFKSVMSVKSSLNDQRIRLETSIETLEKDIQEKVKEILELTGASTFEEAVEVYKSREEEYSKKLEEFDIKLTQFIDSYGEEDSDEVGELNEL